MRRTLSRGSLPTSGEQNSRECGSFPPCTTFRESVPSSFTAVVCFSSRQRLTFTHAENPSTTPIHRNTLAQSLPRGDLHQACCKLSYFYFVPILPIREFFINATNISTLHKSEA